MIPVTDKFHELANGSIRPLDWNLGVSFTKEQRESMGWFVLDASKLDYGDILAETPQSPIQVWDLYDYFPLKERVISMHYARSVAFPYNVQAAVADFSVNNYDGLFNFSNMESPLAGYILPARPCRLQIGFKDSGVDTIQTFAGMTTSIPEYSGDRNEVASFTALDLLSEIGKQSLRNMVKMRDVTVDVVIAEILQQFGLLEHQYDLDTGTAVIPFVYFGQDKNAGNALQQLVQIENGAMWCDESGVIRFRNRSRDLDREPVMVLDKDNIIAIQPSRADQIINTVRVQCDVRAVQVKQPIFSMANDNGYSSTIEQDQWRIGAGGQIVQWLTLDDPAWTISQPVLNGATNSSYIKAKTLSGSEVTTRVSASAELFADSIKLTVTNTNSQPVSVSYLEMWGEPAKVVENIDYEAAETDSVELFGSRVLEITDNELFGSYRNADLLAEDILNKMTGYSPVLEVTVKYDPSLQLQDVVMIHHELYEGDWQIKGIDVKLEKSLEATLTLHRFNQIRSFTLDISQLNGKDILG